jgi:hypothetical protein
MASWYPSEYKMQKRQQALKEKELRQRNDPGQIFLRSLATSTPQAVLSSLGNMAVDAAKYHMFGGKRKQEAEEAVIFKGLRPSFFDKYHKDASAANNAARMAVSPGTLSLGKPAPSPEVKPVSQPTPLPEMVDLGDGTVGVEVGQGATTDAGSGVFPDPVSGKSYRIIPKEQWDQLTQKHKTQTEAYQQYRAQQPTAPSAPPVTSRTPAPPSPDSILGRAEGGFGAQSIKTLEGILSDPYVTSAEAQAATKEWGLNNRKLLEQRVGMEKTFATSQKDLISKELSLVYQGLGITTKESLDKTREKFMMLAQHSPSLIVKRMWANAAAALPSEELRQEAVDHIAKGKGARVWSVTAEREGHKVTVRNPSPRDYSNAILTHQVIIDNLRDKRAKVADGTPEAADYDKQIARQVQNRDKIYNDALTDPKSSRVMMIPDDNGNFFVSDDFRNRYASTIEQKPKQRRDHMENLASKNVPDFQSYIEAIKANGTSGAIRALSDWARIRDSGVTSGEEFDEAAGKVAAMFDGASKLKGQYRKDKPKTTGKKDKQPWEQLYPNLAPVKKNREQINKAYLTLINSALGKQTISDQGIWEALAGAITTQEKTFGHKTPPLDIEEREKIVEKALKQAGLN